MKVKDLMTTNISCIRENTTVQQAASYMRKDDIGCIPVCDDSGHIRGILTDRDIVLRTLASDPEKDRGSKPRTSVNDILSGDIMTLSPVTVSPEANIHDAALLFSAYQIRRLPVVEASRLVGMLSLGDIAAKPLYIDEAGDALSAISLTGVRQAGN